MTNAFGKCSACDKLFVVYMARDRRWTGHGGRMATLGWSGLAWLGWYGLAWPVMLVKTIRVDINSYYNIKEN